MSLAEAQQRPWFEVASWPHTEIIRWRIWSIVQKRAAEQRRFDAKSQ